MLRNEGAYQVSAIILLLSVLSAVLGGCVMNRWIHLETGDYIHLRTIGGANETVTAKELVVDRDKQLATFTLVDGTTIVVSIFPRDQANWPVGCPANIGSTYMEILDIEEGSLTIGALTLEDPILVRDCPPEPMRIVLREDGLVGGGGSACAGLDKCLYFGRQSQAAPVLTAPIVSAKPLPPSMKGYELYSWYDEEDDSWHYTLITGTNRLKTIEEITARENKVTSSGWVKITVTGTEGLKALLERLPPGTELTWRGEDWLESEGQATVNVMLPDSNVLEVIQNHCRQLEIRLYLNQ